MPAHIDGAVAPAVPWATKVNQRNAPGAMSAIAFIVKPVRPRVGFIVGSALSAIVSLLCVGGIRVTCGLTLDQKSLLRRKICDHSEQDRGLRRGAIRLIVLFKERLVRPVVAELGASHQPVRQLVCGGQREFLNRLGRSGGEYVHIVEE